MKSTTRNERKSPANVRVGVYSTVAAADLAVQELLQAGFTSEQISVICSDAAKEQHFKRFEHADPSGSHTVEYAAKGGAIGALLGGFVAIAGTVATGGVALLAAGGVAAWTGAVAGGLVGAMMTRGIEPEIADYYDQAVVQGKILVAVEADDAAAPEMLAGAEVIFRETGADPVALNEFGTTPGEGDDA